MASTFTCCQKPPFKYFKSTVQQAQRCCVGQFSDPLRMLCINSKSLMDRLISLKQRSVCASPERDSNPATDPATSTDDSILTPSTTSDSLIVSENPLLKQRKQPTLQIEDVFDFGSVEDWMDWDEPSDAALSPTSSFAETSSQTRTFNVKRRTQQGAMGFDGVKSSRVKDEPVFIEDPVSPGPFFPTPADMISTGMPMSSMQSRTGLYSPSFSWSRPTIGQIDPSNRTVSPHQATPFQSAAEPPIQTYESDAISPTSASSAAASEKKRRKRDSSAEPEVDEEEEEESPLATSRNPPKKTAHNMIEKRYRTNLNDKIAALRDSVPALRVISKKTFQREDAAEDLQGLTPAHKLNKATILSKATEYIAHLEKQNGHMAAENAALKARVDAFEMLLMPRPPQPQQQQQQQQQQHHRQLQHDSQRWMG